MADPDLTRRPYADLTLQLRCYSDRSCKRAANIIDAQADRIDHLEQHLADLHTAIGDPANKGVLDCWTPSPTTPMATARPWSASAETAPRVGSLRRLSTPRHTERRATDGCRVPELWCRLASD